MSGSVKSLAEKNWAETLTQAEHALAQALETVRQRQRALDDYFQNARAADRPVLNWPQALDDSYQRAQNLATLVERASASVAEVDTALAEGESELRQWLEATGAAREKLATWLAGAIR